MGAFQGEREEMPFLWKGVFAKRTIRNYWKQRSPVRAIR